MLLCKAKKGQDLFSRWGELQHMELELETWSGAGENPKSIVLSWMPINWSSKTSKSWAICQKYSKIRYLDFKLDSLFYSIIWSLRSRINKTIHQIIVLFQMFSVWFSLVWMCYKTCHLQSRTDKFQIRLDSSSWTFKLPPRCNKRFTRINISTASLQCHDLSVCQQMGQRSICSKAHSTVITTYQQLNTH